jgi:glutamate-1-semialdehyde 2,1-aminomutase
VNRRDDRFVPAAFAASAAYHRRASKVLPRGVSSSPRATQRPVPLAVATGEGAHITDLDGRLYVDYAMGYGPLILGHSPAVVVDALHREIERGLRVGGVTTMEAELAERIATLYPGVQMSSFVSTGTEACQLALRLARAVTGRLTVVKFRCHYHGWSDAIHVATDPANDGPATAGQDPDALHHVRVLDWGDASALDTLVASDVAAIIMEPAAINAGCFEPPAGYLAAVRDWTSRHGIVLIFDEVITGFRVALGGAQQKYGVQPDLTVLGKALGAGMPISAVSGRAELLQPIASGAVSQRGTYNGHPLSVAAAIACIDYLTTYADTVYPHMEAHAEAIAQCVRESPGNVAANRLGPCVQLFAGTRSVPSLADLKSVDREHTIELTGAMLERGVAALPRGMMYLSAAHTDDDIALTVAALRAALAACVRL